MSIITITQTPAPLGKTPQVDLIRAKFDELIWQKGYEVIKESAVKCPCVSPATNQQSNCKNCGGSGWIFVNATKTRMVMHTMNMSTKFKQWTEQNIGTASISCMAVDELSFMDRITTLDGNAIYSEALFVKENSGTYYFNTIYDIKEIVYIGLFQGSTVKLKELIYETDFTYIGNRIVFLTAENFINPLLSAEDQDISIAIRYKHAPQFHVIDIPRETMQTFNKTVGNKEEGPIDLPIHAVGRRSHYVMDRQNYDGTRVVDNTHEQTYEQLNPAKSIC